MIFIVMLIPTSRKMLSTNKEIIEKTDVYNIHMLEFQFLTFAYTILMDFITIKLFNAERSY